MSALAWVGIIVTASLALVLAFIFSVPKRYAGKLLLKKELRDNRIAVDRLPPVFFTESIAWAEGVAKVSANTPVARRAEFVRCIENLARVAALWAREPDSKMFASYGNSKNFYRELFEKYDVKAN
jgi:hypothetical protein